MKKLLLLLIVPVFALMFTGCAEEESTEPNSGQNSGQNTVTPEQLAAVDEAFYNEYKKQVTEAPQGGNFSPNAENNIKLFLQNITGRGMMPSTAGIGEIHGKNVASAIGKKVVEDFKKAEEEPKVVALTKYSELDVDANAFLSKVVSGIMGGQQGKKTIASLKLYQANQDAIELLVKSHAKRFGKQKVQANGYVNLAYFYANLTGYFGMLNIKKLPTDPKKVEEVTKVVFEHCKSKPEQNSIEKWNMDTPSFKVMPILTCGTMDPTKQEMTEFMTNLGKVFDPNYSYNPPVIPPRPPKPSI